MQLYSHFQKKMRMFVNTSILLCILFTTFISIAIAANNHLVHYLYVNNDVRVARDFQLVILPTTISNGSGTGTDNYVGGWLGAFVEGAPSGADFIQTGTIADGAGIRWFAYTNTEVLTYCLRGVLEWNGNGCLGGYDDHVGLSQITTPIGGGLNCCT